MTKYEDIFDIAADNHGLITSAQAREAGITNNEPCNTPSVGA